MVVAMSLQQADGIYIYNTRFKKNWPIQKEIVFPNPQLPQYAHTTLSRYPITYRECIAAALKAKKLYFVSISFHHGRDHHLALAPHMICQNMIISAAKEHKLVFHVLPKFSFPLLRENNN
ncbi:hypothetical protein T4D_2631 [Trichinella pseudospiralis]|uniref:Uncharacterized protein n=1 Tax=Trichinella pseudospiralis TaxID=6337 RepID=A0A0V1F5V1_TRIPS|nr:hypothetical protein T4D_2631 [Trichinella pseudospiralis]